MRGVRPWWLVIAAWRAPAALAATTAEVAPGVALDRWQPEDGIPSGTLYSLAADDLGRLVMGTSDGVGFYDGLRFTVERQGDVIAPPEDRALWVGADPEDGALWIVTQDGFAQRRLGGHTEDFGPFALGGHPLQRTGQALLVTDGDRLLALHVRPTPVEGLPEGAWRFRDLPDGRYALVGDTVLRRPPGEPGFRVADPDARAALDEALTLPAPWSVTPEGVTWRGRLVLPGGRSLADVITLDGEVWAGLAAQGLARLRQTAVRSVATPDPQDTWTSQVVWDAVAGEVWAAFPRHHGWWTADDPRRSARFTTVRLAPDAPASQRPLDGIENLVPVAAGGRRWWVLDGTMRPQRSADDDPVLVLGAPATPTCSFNQYTPVVEDARGRAWIGWGAVYEQGAWTPLPGFCGEAFGEVRGLAEVPGGVLFANPRELLRVPLDTAHDVTTWRRVPIPADAHPRHLHVADGQILLSTERLGLCLLSLDDLAADPPWRCAGRAAGLETQVHAAIGDGLGRVWISTNRGLLVVPVAALARYGHEPADLPVVRVGTSDGLASEELNGYLGLSVAREPSGALWFPGREGVVRVDPAAFSPPARVGAGVAAVRVGGAVRPPADLSRLPPDHEAVTLDLALRPLSWASKVAVRHRVDAGAWVTSGPTLALGALPPGRATIEVQARLLGPWETVARIPIVREPRLTERWFFPAALVSLAGLAATAALTSRNRALSRRRQELQGEVDRHTEALRQRTTDLEANQVELLTRSRTIEEQAERLRGLDRLKSEFIADIAHELRTPLTLLLGSLEQGEPADVGVARRNAETLHLLVEQLFQLQDLDKGKLPLRARRIDLARSVADSVGQFAEAFAAAGRELVGPEPGAFIELWANASAVRRITANLLQNALRYGQGRTEVRLGVEGVVARIEVLDRGPGVPPEDRARVFERFVQLSTGDTRVAEGMGIGLAMVRELIELHGGEVGVDDAPGGGARFWLTLPLGSDHLTVDDIESEVTPLRVFLPPLAPEPPEPPAAGPLLLVVEDNDELRSWLVQRLVSRYRVVEARDGGEGLEMALAHRPAAILSDVRMPRKDGLQMARELRAHPAIGGTPVMFLSAKAMVEDRVEGLQVADDYLCKPFATQELLLRLARLVDGAPPVEPAPPVHVQELLDRLAATADRRMAEPEFGVAQLAKAMAMSTRTLQDRMKALDLPPPGPWLLERRLTRAHALLREGRLETVGEVAGAVGMSPAYLSRAYRAWSGLSPSEELRR